MSRSFASPRLERTKKACRTSCTVRAPAKCEEDLQVPMITEMSSPACDSENKVAVVLEACKFVSKRSKEVCSSLPAVVCHKRGHLAVSCSAGHQVIRHAAKSFNAI